MNRDTKQHTEKLPLPVADILASALGKVLGHGAERAGADCAPALPPVVCLEWRGGEDGVCLAPSPFARCSGRPTGRLLCGDNGCSS
ncbi:hypothetical protein HK100_010836 [Physocladia obscura]|uniref:Uncharacterized protein n=1 Tax=Physocladia obscura TaxID=109957 RepID=A0AAD5T2P0_9FUNG|nr:hypothetical protein HK100_010836 [Physocladia obscura]